MTVPIFTGDPATSSLSTPASAPVQGNLNLLQSNSGSGGQSSGQIFSQEGCGSTVPPPVRYASTQPTPYDFNPGQVPLSMNSVVGRMQQNLNQGTPWWETDVAGP